MPLPDVSQYPNLPQKDIDTPPTPSVTPATTNATASQTEQAIAQGTFDGAVAQAAIQDVQNDVLASAIFRDRKSTRLNSSHVATSYAVFCLNNKKAPRAVSSPRLRRRSTRRKPRCRP